MMFSDKKCNYWLLCQGFQRQLNCIVLLHVLSSYGFFDFLIRNETHL